MSWRGSGPESSASIQEEPRRLEIGHPTQDGRRRRLDHSLWLVESPNVYYAMNLNLHIDGQLSYRLAMVHSRACLVATAERHVISANASRACTHA